MTDLYRAFDSANQLLYVGIAEDLYLRIQTHSYSSGWFDAADRLVVEWYGTREEARAAETAAIKAERPLWNIVNSPLRGNAVLLRPAPFVEFRLPTREELEERYAICDMRNHKRLELVRSAERRHPAKQCGAVA